MVRMRETIESFDVVGLPLRTSNREASLTIPPHWRDAADAGLLDPEKPGVGPGVYAVYTDYETPGDDVDGIYTLVIGRRIEVGSPVPPGQVTVTVPGSSREIMTVVDARPESIYEAWVGVWSRQDLARDYCADYEYYAPDGSIRLSIGVLSGA
ncbi:Bacterial transcription activator, effector binding domain [Actinomyces viscosus]|uniref:Bacterial transcription activator, effector binding domain n=2 Tax=Actinomyces viscosus TaxID=1656 RepID=A0A3S4WKT1_ACTVI|nr:Bacterial transcription activator, effector binding domain [Actinomyces viscosus]